MAFYGWPAMSDDVVALLAALDLRACIGVGHSMGGNVVCRAALRAPERFRALLLVDPTMFRRTQYQPSATVRWFPFVVNRAARFASATAMFDRLRDRPSFAAWPAGTLFDYCVHALERAPDAAAPLLPMRLRLPALDEATVFATGMLREAMLQDEIAQSRTLRAVSIVRAQAPRGGAREGMFLGSPTDPALHECFAGVPFVRDEQHDELTHFIPAQAPQLVAERAVEVLAHSLDARL